MLYTDMHANTHALSDRHAFSISGFSGGGELPQLEDSGGANPVFQMILGNEDKQSC